MPYANIVFVKLEKRLLNDYRWYTLSEQDQLIYIKLLLLAAETYNKIPKKMKILKQALRCSCNEKELKSSIIYIMSSFPKLKQNNDFYYFEEFEHKTNWVNPKEHQRNSKGTPKVVTEEEEEQEEEKNKNKILHTEKPIYRTTIENRKSELKKLGGILNV
jgi:hypothetical protein